MSTIHQGGTLLELKTGPHILVRIVWYLVVGWWLTAIAMALAWLVALTVIGLPLAFWLINRIPTTLTLRPRREQYLMVTGAGGITRMQRVATHQTALPIRFLYFLLIGWWASLIWMIVSYILMLTVLGIPLGMMMVNRLPFVYTLHRGYA